MNVKPTGAGPACRLRLTFAQIGRFFFAVIAPIALCGCQGTAIGTTLTAAIAPKAPPRDITRDIGSAGISVQQKSTALPTDFPDLIPRYPQAVLQEIRRSPQQLMARWFVKESSDRVVVFYRDAFRQGWQNLLGAAAESGTLVVEKDGLLVTVSVQPQQDGTQILLHYVRDVKIGVQTVQDLESQDKSPASPLPVVSSAPVIAFTDLDTLPEAWRTYIQELATLAVLTPKRDRMFEPNASISRREYARWLFAVNNRFYKNRPSRQIRPALPTASPTFSDVPAADPDFDAIQGLADAGLLGNAVREAPELFRPDALLIREELPLWKVPLDIRQPLPVATVDTVRRAWGFQDSDRIAPRALQALQADALAGDLANVRRSFGFTTRFLPQKPVTRAEAAAALWYFGTGTEGISAQTVLELERLPAGDRATVDNLPVFSPSSGR